MYKTDNSTGLIYKTTTIEENNELYYIKVEMVDGSSQILQISKEQAVELGIDLSNETPEEIQKANQIFPEKNQELIIDGDNYNTKEQEIIVDCKNSTEYRILQPEDVNLKPLKGTDFLPTRGTLKRSIDRDKITFEPRKKIKTVRTRSGRVSVPPKHIQQVYMRFIETKDLSNANTSTEATPEQSRSPSPLLIGDFTPLQTNGELVPPLVPIETVNIKPKTTNKSLLVTQFRCTTCNKAYIGQGKMRKHLKAFPEHRPNAKLNLADTKTWDCLVDVSKVAPVGKRGVKFCRELLNLLQNVKILVRYFFKLQKKLDTNDNDGDINEKGHYLMNDLLAKVLDIEKGWYTFNENELCKDVSIYSFLENFNSSVLSSLSINDNGMADGPSNVTEKDVISTTKNLMLILNDENVLKINDDKNNKKFDVLSNVTITPNLENVPNDCCNKSIQEHLDNNTKSILNYENKNDIFSKFLHDQCTAEKQNSIEQGGNNKSVSETISIDTRHYSQQEKEQNVKKKINKESETMNISDVNLSREVKTDLLIDNSNSVDSINVDQFKYRIGELVVDNSDLPPLDIFQYDSSNQ